MWAYSIHTKDDNRRSAVPNFLILCPAELYDGLQHRVWHCCEQYASVLGRQAYCARLSGSGGPASI